ncbi:rRNA methyltransferase [Cavenderia fasciculata]|uniref:rRNA methyltransferase 2, mitochondrial n=1 Tax=Cavenderia fasciculata TaxID=261658 RepID=F4PR52_CACFS|nr:rRNA methyltransferase [Cavenderia fasciculata]EGG22109.1 rRNA methyltransferase [Cavenderia fasciculata]|eukprot:XP_004359960.1 rRNA methyltransferase [Cavenderia fasciculata]
MLQLQTSSIIQTIIVKQKLFISPLLRLQQQQYHVNTFQHLNSSSSSSSRLYSTNNNHHNNNSNDRSAAATRGILPRSIAKNLRTSDKWVKRQMCDRFVSMAREENYVSRAAFKLEEIDDKFKILKYGSTIIDLGASPGGFSQVAQKRCYFQTINTTLKSSTTNKNNQQNNQNQLKKRKGLVISVDINGEKFELYQSEEEGIAIEDRYTNFICGDFKLASTKQQIRQLLALNNKKTIASVDAVISDMAPSYCGVQSLDHDRLISLASDAFEFAISGNILKKGGSFVCKVSRGGQENLLFQRIKSHFQTVKSFKPKASRQESTEIFFVALNFLDQDNLINNNNQIQPTATTTTTTTNNKNSIYDDDDN